MTKRCHLRLPAAPARRWRYTAWQHLPGAARLDDALQFHQRALDIREKARNPQGVVRSLCQIAIVRERRGELAEAEAAHVRALTI